MVFIVVPPTPDFSTRPRPRVEMRGHIRPRPRPLRYPVVGSIPIQSGKKIQDNHIAIVSIDMISMIISQKLSS